jgi:hypothetical protein
LCGLPIARPSFGSDQQHHFSELPSQGKEKDFPGQTTSLSRMLVTPSHMVQNYKP